MGGNINPNPSSEEFFDSLQFPQFPQDDGTVVQETLDGAIFPETRGRTVIPDHFRT